VIGPADTLTADNQAGEQEYHQAFSHRTPAAGDLRADQYGGITRPSLMAKSRHRMSGGIPHCTRRPLPSPEADRQPPLWQLPHCHLGSVSDCASRILGPPPRVLAISMSPLYPDESSPPCPKPKSGTCFSPTMIVLLRPSPMSLKCTDALPHWKAPES